MARDRYYNIVQQAGERTADVYIFGDIVSYQWDESDTSAWSFTRELQAIEADTIRVHIDSYGGSVSEGWAIYNTLINHPARIETYADGFVASAAIYPYLAGDVRQASPVAAFYFHEIMTSAYGYAEDLEKAAEEIRKLTDIGVQAFVERTGMTAEAVKALMADETWLSPAEALERGIVTKIVTERDDGRRQQSARVQVVSRLLEKREKPAEPVPKEEAKEADNHEPKTAETLLQKLARLYAKKED